MSPAADPLTRLVRACNPNQHLEVGDQRYVNFDDARGKGENLLRLVRAFRRSEEPLARLFAGHRGIGKTSELKRLKGMLEKGEEGQQPFQVIFFDAANSLDFNDLEFSDLLILIAKELLEQLQDNEQTGFVLQTAADYLVSRWQQLWDLLLKEVKIKEAQADLLGFATLTLELKNRPSARKAIRDKIELLATDLLQGINQLLDEANASLQKQGKAGLILIVDGLDKISLREVDGTNTHNRLFVDRAEHLAGLRAHVVYTVPVSLVHSTGFSATVQSKFGGDKVLTPMVRIRGEDKSAVEENTCGMNRLWEMLDLRCKYAGLEIDKTFESKETWLKLCEMSGGHPRHLLTLLTSAANQQDKLPITTHSVERAIQDYANSLLLEIPREHWEKLAKFNEPLDVMPHDETHLEMLFALYIFQYFNGAPWYEVNPVIRTLPRFQEFVT